MDFKAYAHEVEARFEAIEFLVFQMYADTHYGDPRHFETLRDVLQAGMDLRETGQIPIPPAEGKPLSARAHKIVDRHMAEIEKSIARRLPPTP